MISNKRNYRYILLRYILSVGAVQSKVPSIFLGEVTKDQWRFSSQLLNYLFF